MTVDFDAVAEAISPRQLAEAVGAEETNRGWRCPLGETRHTNGDRDPSFSVFRDGERTAARCHGCGLRGSPVTVASEVWGVEPPEAARKLARSIGLRPAANGGRPGRSREPEAVYTYRGRDGEILFQVVRFPGKQFRQRSPNPDGDGWEWTTKGVEKPLYRITDVVERAAMGGTIYVVEGEKDADRLREEGVTATTCAGGAGSWRDRYAEALEGAHVRIVADRDDAGREHAREVAASLDGVAASVKLLLPAVEEKGADVSDHLDAGHTLDELVALPGPGPEAGDEREQEFGERDLTHDGLALDLGDAWESDARHVAAWGSWFFWDGSVWRRDETLEHMTRARQFLRALADRLGEDHEKAKKKLRSAHTVARVVSLARSNEAQAAEVDQWDANPWLLGTPDGTVDLRTGEIRESRPEDYITKSTSVAPAPEGTTGETWTSFLEDVTAGNEALQHYLQRFAGYSLTGLIKEHAFLFAHGTGANGKSVFSGALNGVLGDYALTVPTEMLMVSRESRHPTELARLRGVRLAVGSEMEQGKRWAESKIKALTGGDPIAARFMRQDFFEFDPQFKLFIVGNHRPSLRGVDEAMRRRLHLVPFTVTIPPEERDLDLPKKLEAEWPAILRWAIDGCLAWQREGLNPPASVQEATEEYLDTEDAFSLWIEECAIEDPNAFESSSALYNSWRRWAEQAGEFVGSKKRLSRELQKRGYEQKRHGSAGTRGYVGLRLEPVEDEGWSP